MDEELAFRLIDLQDALGGQYGVLSRPKLRLLVKLTRGAVRVSELAERLHISSPAVSQMIDKLAVDGLVTRVAIGSDQRLVGVSLTSAGHTALSEALTAFEERVHRLMAPLGPQEQAQLVSLLSKMEMGRR